MSDNDKIECTKVKFSDEKQADYYIRKLQNTSHREKKPISSYLCPHCFNWHLTSKIERVKIEKKDPIVLALEEEKRKLNNELSKLKESNSKLQETMKNKDIHNNSIDK